MNNYNYLINKWYRDNNNLYRNQNEQNQSLFTPQIGYDNGNLFSDIYEQYKNYKPVTLNGKSEKEKLWLELARMSFAAHDLNLYLDVYPNDSTMLTLFNDYRNKANQLIQEYESKYGPLNISSTNDDQVPFTWENKAWPWEGGLNV